MADEFESRGKAAPVAAASLSLVLPAIYVFMLGPLVWLRDNGYFSPPLSELLFLPYLPLAYLHGKFSFVNHALDWYLSWWT